MLLTHLQGLTIEHDAGWPPGHPVVEGVHKGWNTVFLLLGEILQQRRVMGFENGPTQFGLGTPE